MEQERQFDGGWVARQVFGRIEFFQAIGQVSKIVVETAGARIAGVKRLIRRSWIAGRPGGPPKGRPPIQ